MSKDDFIFESGEMKEAILNEAIKYDRYIRRAEGNSHRIKITHITEDLSELYGHKILPKHLDQYINLNENGHKFKDCRNFIAWVVEDVLARYDEEKDRNKWAKPRTEPPRKGYREEESVHHKRLRKARRR